MSTFSFDWGVVDDGVGAEDDGPFGGVDGGGGATEGDDVDCWGCLLMKALLTVNIFWRKMII